MDHIYVCMVCDEILESVKELDECIVCGSDEIRHASLKERENYQKEYMNKYHKKE